MIHNNTMTQKKVTWHIGVNKTGSATLESFCVNQHEWLKKQGISFFRKHYFISILGLVLRRCILGDSIILFEAIIHTYG